MTNFSNTLTALNAVKSAEIKISETKSGEAIHQTQRNKIGSILREALFKDLSTIFPTSTENGSIVAYLTADGIILEIPNDSVADNLASVDGSGAISVEIGFSIKSLEYNARDSAEAYVVTLAEKEAKEKKKAEDKAKKIARDKVLREKKKPTQT